MKNIILRGGTQIIEWEGAHLRGGSELYGFRLGGPDPVGRGNKKMNTKYVPNQYSTIFKMADQFILPLRPSASCDE